MPKNCYALLVGINRYQHFNSLEGCLADVQAVGQYLRQALGEQDCELHLGVLQDAEATKDNIVFHFLNHLSKAGEGDLAFFFYAGHGAREVADPVFHETDSDQQLEILVCYDSVPGRSGMDLSDKELRYLIHKVAAGGAHVLTVFDCCFSGSNTRQAVAEGKPAQVRRLAAPKPKRSWQDFIFGAEFLPFQIEQAGGVHALLPHGAHVQLAACRDNEEANEHPALKRGVFSLALVEVLQQAKGHLTYHDLMGRMRMRMAQIIQNLRMQGVQLVDQHPQLFTFGDAYSDRFRLVLNGAISQRESRVSVSFDLNLQQWKMDAGALHGVPQPGLHPTFVEVFRPQASEQPAMQAQVSAVSPAYSLLRFLSHPQPAVNELLSGKVKGLVSRPIDVALQGEASMQALLRRQLQQDEFVHLTSSPEEADYLINYKEGAFHWHVPEHERPILAPVRGSESFVLDETERYLRHIAHWEYARQLQNLHTRFHRCPVEMQLFRLRGPGGRGQRLIPQNGLIRWKHHRFQGTPRIFFKVKLVNHSEIPLYVALVYMSQTFQVMPHLLEDSVAQILPGEEQALYAKGGEALEFRIPPYILHYQWPYATDYLKLVVCTEPFELDFLSLPALPAPEVPGQVRSMSARFVRSGQKLSFTEHDWISDMVVLHSYPPA